MIKGISTLIMSRKLIITMMGTVMNILVVFGDASAIRCGGLRGCVVLRDNGLIAALGCRAAP